MIQGKTDPRRPDKVQRYKAPQANGNNPVEDLTPDYMNILGPESTRAGGAAVATASASNEPVQAAEDAQQPSPPPPMECDANQVIPTSPQYGVAIITATNDIATAPESDPNYKISLTPQDVAVVDACHNNKDAVMHTTPSRTTNHINSNNDRFKVVKIATLEPFRRGRWKCMDYVDENPPVSATACKSANNNNSVAQHQQQQQQQQQQYIQTQSLPQQHFQQMQQQFYQNMGGAQVQFFYPPQSGAQQPPSTTTTYISSGGGGGGGGGAGGGATYYQQVIPNSSGGMTLVNYPGVQYVPANILQTQAGSAFVPTGQNINSNNNNNTATAQLPPNLQQGQTYTGPSSSVTPSTQQQPLVNGHAFPPPTPTVTEQQQQATTVAVAAQQTAPPITSTLPTHAQVAKGVILGTQQQVPAGQYTVTQQQQQPVAPSTAIFQNNTSTQVTPVASAIVTQSSMSQQPAPVSNHTASVATAVATNSNNNLVAASLDATSAAAAAAAVYANPQFVASVNKIVESAVSMIDAAAANANTTNPMQRGQQDQPNLDTQTETTTTNNTEQTGPTSTCATSAEDTATKANPVVNAIDNKIEQAMDLVKSHLMFTVREEVEVLKEKIAELMEKIQQLESENSMLRFQMPSQKQHVIIQQHAANSNMSSDTAPATGQQQQQQ